MRIGPFIGYLLLLAASHVQMAWSFPQQPGVEATNEQCVECHSKEWNDWKGAFHAHSVSPGLLYQLRSFSPDRIKHCLNCHLPDEREHSDLSALLFEDVINTDSIPERWSVSCVGCHTSTRLTESIRIADAEFCAKCHQSDQIIPHRSNNPLTNTYREWSESFFAKEGIQCQNCHLPDKQHRFRGIHDKEMVLSGVQIRTDVGPDSASLTLKSTAIGHRFPTYSVPKVSLTIRAYDISSQDESVTVWRQEIRRHVEKRDGQWIEISDSRLNPGEAVTLKVPLKHKQVKVHFQVLIEPDAMYLQQYQEDHHLSQDTGTVLLIREAIYKARQNRYVLFEEWGYQEK